MLRAGQKGRTVTPLNRITRQTGPGWTPSSYSSRTARKRRRPSTPSSVDEHDENIVDDVIGAANESINVSPGAQDTLNPPQPSDLKKPDCRLSLDFGTTYCSLSYVMNDGDPEQPLTIGGFKGDHMQYQGGRQVPTEVLYLKRRIPTPPLPIGLRPRPRDRRVRYEYKTLYGYEAQQWLTGTVLREGYEVLCHVQRMKLLINQDDKTCQDQRARLEQLLKDRGLIKNCDDTLIHTLTYYLKHAKSELQRNHGLRHDSTIELIITVPVCWGPKALHTMSRLVEQAMKASQLGYFGEEKKSTLFLVNEAEAGASHALKSRSHNLKIMETFLVIDAGGGTADLASYMVENEYPLRLKTEINTPSGAMVGSSDINQRFYDFVLRICGPGIKTILDACWASKFEDSYKRSFNYLDKRQLFSFFIQDPSVCEPNPRLTGSSFVLSYDDMLHIFMPSLKAIGDLMIEQINEATAKGAEIDKAVLIGGFGDSPALKDYLRIRLDAQNAASKSNTKLICSPTNTSADGVAIGGIIRALDKTHGPARIPRQSIGIYRHIPYEPELNVPHMQQTPCNIDGELVIDGTIEWIIKKDQPPLAPIHPVTFKSIYSFVAEDKIWKAGQVLYSSQTCTRDFYRRSHPYNINKTDKLGKIWFYLSSDQREMILNDMTKEGPLRKGQLCVVELLIEMTFIDRDMKITARWPAVSDGEELRRSVDSFSVPAAFVPGTE
ncbi:uncharacterized protein K460DRAFT_416429 [Cucurbitaria berberidis CBS 394.84]|uniref:Actin-like ATPase domain-containing protein n=1 Tax=Cucurbitaria berberidis CBS 394.84 TaxID=1168544 RepID=A0A9P4GGG4_9PLEO|nr:uncharacterized protein K460DRAFT_416429 [Cucurbitaria berberidis CBS 394.84]KAF1845115.1 hypothetical protein K460DRAFT_416429 [Cucurbitaria berberidis CBS 394.84]